MEAAVLSPKVLQVDEKNRSPSSTPTLFEANAGADVWPSQQITAPTSRLFDDLCQSLDVVISSIRVAQAGHGKLFRIVFSRRVKVLTIKEM